MTYDGVLCESSFICKKHDNTNKANNERGEHSARCPGVADTTPRECDHNRTGARNNDDVASVVTFVSSDEGTTRARTSSQFGLASRAKYPSVSAD